MSASSSPWSSGSVDPSSIWTNSTGPTSGSSSSAAAASQQHLNLLRRYSLRTATPTGISSQAILNSAASLQQQHQQQQQQQFFNSPQPSTTNKLSTCTWEASVDSKYLIAYIVISRQDLELYNHALGFQLSGGKPTQDGQYGAIVEHVTPGSLMNIVCKLKVGDELVEWNGFSLRNKRPDEVADLIDSCSNKSGSRALRLVAVRAVSGSAGPPPSGASGSAAAAN